MHHQSPGSNKILKARIKAIRFSGGDPLTISSLKVRLKHAEAARSVALARKATGGLAVAIGEAERNDARVLAVVLTHVPVVEKLRKPTRGHIIRTEPWRPSTALSVSTNTHAHELARPSAKHSGSAAHLLASAKRSLAIARSQLTQIPDAAPNTSDKNEISVAGLLRWPGSEAWSLSAQRA